MKGILAGMFCKLRHKGKCPLITVMLVFLMLYRRSLKIYENELSEPHELPVT